MSDSDSEYEFNYLDPGHIRDRTSAVYRRRPQYVASRPLATRRVSMLDPDDEERIFGPRPVHVRQHVHVSSVEGMTELFRQVDGHDYDSGGNLSMLADVASSHGYEFID